MNTFYVITNYQKDPELRTASLVRDYLEQKGKVCYIQGRECKSAEGHEKESHYRYTDAGRIPAEVEGVLVIGGDGTLLQAARDTVDRGLPLLGINMGTLGYLAEIECKNIIPALDRLIEGQYMVEQRMMLYGEAGHHGKKMMGDIALNDIVITRNGRLRVVDFNVYVDGEFLKSYSADGVIISTPTGSTGYNLSAGGPIVAPQASMMLLTAIAPHTLTTRPIVLPDDVAITIEIGAGHGTDMDGAEVTFDGDTSVKLNSGDRITVTRSQKTAQLIKTKNTSFLEILREKMNK